MSSDRVYNFSAGPSCMPVEILEQAAQEMTNWHGAGMGVMEMSHRSKEYTSIIQKCEKDMRDILDIPEEYKVLYLQGGATTQFASIPLNLLGDKASADYVVTGQWSQKAYEECLKYGGAKKVIDMKPTKYTTIAPEQEWQRDSDAAYIHYCMNETVNGVEFKHIPDAGNVDLIADMSSNFISTPIHCRKHALIYAGAQKNAGPAGVTVVLVRDDLLNKQKAICPTALSYKTFASAGSMYNTPPTYPIYMMGLYLQYTKEKGGLSYWDELADKKSNLLYDTIDGSDGFFSAPVEKAFRSRMNVPFQILGGNEVLEKKFMEEAKKMKLFTLAGHRSVGGCRASLYNGMPLEGVVALTDFMKSFAQENAQ